MKKTFSSFYDQSGQFFPYLYLYCFSFSDYDILTVSDIFLFFIIPFGVFKIGIQALEQLI